MCTLLLAPIFIIEGVLTLGLGIALGVATTALIIIPTYLIQIVRLIKILIYWRNKSYDTKKNKIDATRIKDDEE